MSVFDIEPYGDAVDGRTKPDLKGYCGGVHLAPWWRRIVAALIDYAAPLWVIPNVTMGLFGLGSSLTLWLVVGFIFYNSIYLPTEDGQGQSLGKGLLGLKLAYGVRGTDDKPYLVAPSMGRCLGRLLLHVFDWCFLVGVFRPLWDPDGQTFADEWLGTIVIHERPDYMLEHVVGPRVL